jgi:hypothetical protein
MIGSEALPHVAQARMFIGDSVSQTLANFQPGSCYPLRGALRRFEIGWAQNWAQCSDFLLGILRQSAVQQPSAVYLM